VNTQENASDSEEDIEALWEVGLQGLAADEIRPSADFAWDTFHTRKFLAHAAGEELCCLLFFISFIQV
jgi:hypothetical protein